MKLHISKAWQLGLLVLLLNVIMNELALVFDDYVYHRMGINQKYLSFVLWSFPLFAAYIASYYSGKYKVVLGLSYMLIFPFMATLGHYINGKLGGAVDFVGIPGAIVFFKIHFVISSFIIIIGTALGTLISSGKSSVNKRGGGN